MGRDYFYRVISDDHYKQLVANGEKRKIEGESNYYSWDNDEMPDYIDESGNYYGHYNYTELKSFRSKCDYIEGTFSYDELKKMVKESLEADKFMDAAAFCIILDSMSEGCYAIIRNS